MKNAFLISGLVEIVGAIVVYFNAEAIFPDSGYLLSKMYGIAAFVLGMISFLFWRKPDQDSELYKQVFLCFMFFHAALAFSSYATPLEIFPLKLGSTLTHLFVFVVFFISYMNGLKPDQS